MLDISKIKSKQIIEALNESEKSSNGLFQVILEDSDVEPEFISELNQVLQELPDIKNLEIATLYTKIDGIDFSKIASNKLEQCLIWGFNIDKSDFSEFIGKQESLEKLVLEDCQISDLSFLDYRKDKLSDVYLSKLDLKNVSIEDLFKLWLKLDKLDLSSCEGNFLEDNNKFLKEILSDCVNNFNEKFVSNLPDLVKDFISGTSAIPLDDYLKLSKYIDLNDGIQRKIYIPDVAITDEYIEKINELNTNENLMLILDTDQIKEFGDKLNDNLYVGINFENEDEAVEFENYPDYIKEIIISSSIVTKEQVEKLIETDKRIRGKDKELYLEIKNASELSVKELDELSEKMNFNIVFNDENLERQHKEPYSISEYRFCRTMIDELISRINMGNENDADREKKIFGQVIRRLANHMSYDYSAIGEKEQEREVISRNMIGGLIEGKCVCTGYSEIVRNVFSCLNIETSCVSGSRSATLRDRECFEVDGKKYQLGGHTWNQIKLDGVWYNMDLTWDRDLLVDGKTPNCLLKSDKDFHHKEYIAEARNCKAKKCNVSVSDEDLNKFIYGDMNKDKIITTEDILSATKDVINDVKIKLKSLCENFSIGETDIKEAYRILVKTKEIMGKMNKAKTQSVEINDD